MIYESYAETADLEEFLGLAAPSDATRLLQRASELIKQNCIGNIDTNIVDHPEALKLATCAQVEYWLEIGESISKTTGIASTSIGSFSVSFNADGMNQLAPRARNFLNQQGLLYRGIKSLRGLRSPYANDEFFTE